jgi:hypothetical protein
VTRDETRRRMTTLVQRWDESKETQAVFAQHHGVSPAKLRYWVRRLASRQADAPAVTFTPVRVRDVASPERGTIVVSLATGEHLVISPGAPADLVRAVVAALRATC